MGYFTYLKMVSILGWTNPLILTFDPNFQRDNIFARQVGAVEDSDVDSKLCISPEVETWNIRLKGKKI